MRVLHIGNLRFKLPEDFSGSFADGLRLVADYLDKPKPELAQKCKSDDLWIEFMTLVAEGRNLLAKEVALVSWNPENCSWDHMPLKTGGGLS